MKKAIFFILVLMVSTTTVSFAQKKSKKKKNFKWGINAGISSSDIKPTDLLITDNESIDRFVLDVKDAKYGANLGAFFHFKTGKRFFIRPEIRISSTRTDFELQELRTTGPINNIVTESYHNITMPLNMGIQIGFLRIQAGAVGSYHVGGQSCLEDYDGYNQNFNGVGLGWQAIIGFDIWKFNFDIKYGGDLGQYGDHMEFFGNSVAFDDKEKQSKFTIGWTF